MKGYRFYQEFSNKAKTRSLESVVAVALDSGHWYDGVWGYDAIGGTFSDANPYVCGTSASASYLRVFCKRISEATARGLHPRLFQYLDEGESNDG